MKTPHAASACLPLWAFFTELLGLSHAFRLLDHQLLYASLLKSWSHAFNGLFRSGIYCELSFILNQVLLRKARCWANGKETWNEKLVCLHSRSSNFSRYLTWIWFLAQVQMKMPSSCSWQPAATINASKLRQHTKRPMERWEKPLGMKERTKTITGCIIRCVLLTQSEALSAFVPRDALVLSGVSPASCPPSAVMCFPTFLHQHICYGSFYSLVIRPIMNTYLQ